jgi:hypothetical protein
MLESSSNSTIGIQAKANGNKHGQVEHLNKIFIQIKSMTFVANEQMSLNSILYIHTFQCHCSL